jgi:hypothetical protein
MVLLVLHVMNVVKLVRPWLQSSAVELLLFFMGLHGRQLNMYCYPARALPHHHLTTVAASCPHPPTPAGRSQAHP